MGIYEVPMWMQSDNHAFSLQGSPAAMGSYERLVEPAFHQAFGLADGWMLRSFLGEWWPSDLGQGHRQSAYSGNLALSGMDEHTRELVEAVRELYRPIFSGAEARITRGHILWGQFETAVEDCENRGRDGESGLNERINEMCVAKVLAEDPHLAGTISYEPNLLADNRRIDFVAEREQDNLYVEVKSVHPNFADTQRAWDLYQERKRRHPQQADFIVEQEWMGGAIYGNAFTARSRFLQYSLEFEERLAAAKATRGGPGILIFCGNGARWHPSNLEDFADFYHFGRHRHDDPFANMEQHHIEDHQLLILRNIDHFACLIRPAELPENTRFWWPVRGPGHGGVDK